MTSVRQRETASMDIESNDGDKYEKKHHRPSPSSANFSIELQKLALWSWTNRRMIATGLVGFLVFAAVVGFVLFRMSVSGKFDPDVKGKTMVIYGHKDTWFTLVQGMFSDFQNAMGALVYAQKHGAARLRIYYDHPTYVDPAHGPNWWAYFFPEEIVLDASIEDPPEVHVNGILGRYGHYGSFVPILTGSPPEYTPFPAFWGSPRKKIAKLVQQYVQVTPKVMDKVNGWWNKHIAPDDFVIGIHYRGTDKKYCCYPYMSPPYDWFLHYLKEVEKKYKPANLKIFVATDETEFVAWMASLYKGNVYTWPESPKLSAEDEIATMGGTHKDKRFSTYVKAETSVVDMLLLAKCSYLIKNRSSLSDVSLMYNGKLPWTMIVGVDDPLISSDGLPEPEYEWHDNRELQPAISVEEYHSKLMPLINRPLPGK